MRVNMQCKRPRPSSIIPTMLVFCIAALAPAASTSFASQLPRATTARTLNVSESASLRLTSHHRSVLNEAGSATGSFNCPLTITLNISYTTAGISFSICRSGGSFSGSGKASYYASGTLAHFVGTVNISHGTGKYAHAAGRGLRIEGEILRNHNYALSVKVHGTMSI